MPKKITETIERMCCEQRDLVVANRTQKGEFAICKYCKTLKELVSVADGAGDYDNEWRDVR